MMAEKVVIEVFSIAKRFGPTARLKGLTYGARVWNVGRTVNEHYWVDFSATEKLLSPRFVRVLAYSS